MVWLQQWTPCSWCGFSLLRWSWLSAFTKCVFELGENCFRKSFFIKPECLAVMENIIFRKMTSGWPIFSPLTWKSFSPLIFTSNHFRRERERERAQIREREPRSRRAAPTSGAVHDRNRRSTSVLVSRRTIVSRSTSSTIVRRAHSSIDEQRGRNRDRRSRHSSGARRTSVLPDLMHFLVKYLNEPNTKINFP